MRRRRATESPSRLLAHRTSPVSRVPPPPLPAPRAVGVESAVAVSEYDFLRLITRLGAARRGTIIPHVEPISGNASHIYLVQHHTPLCACTPRNEAHCPLICAHYVLPRPPQIDPCLLLRAMSDMGARYVRAIRHVLYVRPEQFDAFLTAWVAQRVDGAVLELVELPYPPGSVRVFLCSTHAPRCPLVRSYVDDAARTVVCDAGCAHDLVAIAEPLSFSFLHELVAKSGAITVLSVPTLPPLAVRSQSTGALPRAASAGGARVAPCVCTVCYNEVRVLPGGPTECGSCGVYTCETCYARWLTTQVEGGASTALRYSCCSASVPAAHVARFCERDVAVRHAYFLSRHEQRGNEYAVWCASATCRALLHDIPVRVDASELTCAACGILTCTGCHLEAHAGARCRRPVESLGRRMRSKVWHRAYAKRCPGCDVWIQKNGGCSQMRCSQCQIVFCYRCRRLYKRDNDGTVRGDCACSKAAEAGLFAAALAVMAVVVPVTLAAAIVAGPPLGIVYAVCPRRQKEKVKARVSSTLESWKEELDEERYEFRVPDPAHDAEEERDGSGSAAGDRVVVQDISAVELDVVAENETHAEPIVWYNGTESPILYTGDELERGEAS